MARPSLAAPSGHNSRKRRTDVRAEVHRGIGGCRRPGRHVPMRSRSTREVACRWEKFATSMAANSAFTATCRSGRRCRLCHGPPAPRVRELVGRTGAEQGAGREGRRAVCATVRSTCWTRCRSPSSQGIRPRRRVLRPGRRRANHSTSVSAWPWRSPPPAPVSAAPGSRHRMDGAAGGWRSSTAAAAGRPAAARHLDTRGARGGGVVGGVSASR
jgi:hypothetical protein